MDSAHVDELLASSRRAALMNNPSHAVSLLTQALDGATEPADRGRILLARALAQQGTSDPGPTAADAKASVAYLLEANDTSAASFALASAAGMVYRTGDTAEAIDLSVDALVALPDGQLSDEALVRSANALALLFAQLSTFDLAMSLSRRAFAALDVLPDSPARSIVAYTFGYCAVEGIRSGGMTDETKAEYEADLTAVVGWLTSHEAGPHERAIMGTGMRAEQSLLRHIQVFPDVSETTVATERSELMASLILLEQASVLYPGTASRLVAWHRLVTASVLRQLGETERAEERLNDSVPELISIADEHRIVRALNERSTVRAMAGDLLGALDDAREVARRTRQWQQNQGARLGAQVAHRADLEQARSQLRRRADELAKQASEDPVTGLATRRWLEMQLDELSRSDQLGTVVVLDLDRFKGINDNFGHQTGDEVLAEVGRLFRSVVRSDTRVARFGGEEFVIVLPNVDGDVGMALAERIRTAINSFDWEELVAGLHVTISAGVAHGPMAGVRELVRLADTALYEAKRAGRDRVIGL